MVVDRIFNIDFKKKSIGLHFWFQMFFFNPFKKRDPNIIVPTFNFLPQIGVALNTLTNSSTSIYVGLFNFSITIHVMYWMVCNRDDWMHTNKCE